MDARKGNIYEMLNGNKQFLIPVSSVYKELHADHETGTVDNN